MVSSMNMKFQLLKKIKMLKNTCCFQTLMLDFHASNVKLSTIELFFIYEHN